MLNKLFFASLLALSSSAAVTVATADTAVRAPIPPRPAACLVTTEATTEVFRVERKSDIVKDYTTSSLTVVSNGAWVYTETRNGKVIRTEAGCLPKDQLAALESSLASATWKTSMAEMRCMAYAADYTQYSYNGKPVLTSRMCDGLILDAKTQKGLGDANAIVGKLVPAKKP
jgi:hypothetical protein